MPVTLQVIKGPSAGRKVHVARGQIAKIGRTEWADMPFPNDASMADIHFVIHEDGPHCVIKDSSEGIGTLVNGVPVTEVQLHSGDQVTAGTTVFSVAIDGEKAPVVEPASDTSGEQEQTSSAIPMAVDFGRRLKLSDPAKKLLTDDMSPEDFIDLLVEKELYPDALRFLAFVLPKPIAVGWGCECVDESLSGKLTPVDQKAQDAAKAWSIEPNEQNCRAAEKAAIDTEYSGAAGWMALGAFWSGDSLAPADLPPVPPGEALGAEAISAALTMAATSTAPQHVAARYRTFLNHGRKLISLPRSP